MCAVQMANLLGGSIFLSFPLIDKNLFFGIVKRARSLLASKVERIHERFPGRRQTDRKRDRITALGEQSGKEDCRQMTFNQINYFVKTAELMHMAKAARELKIAQPSLSMSIDKLEKELGLPLFEKYGRGIRLTPEGEIFLVHAKRILTDVEAAKQEMQRIRDTSEEYLTVAYVAPMAEQFLPMVLRGFQEAEKVPPTSLRSVEMNTVEIVTALNNNTADLALCSRIDGHPELTQIPILTQSLVLIAPKGHPLERAYHRTGKPITCQQIMAHPLVTYSAHTSMRERVDSFFKDQACQPKLCHQAGTEMAIAQLVAEQVGVAIVAKIEGLPWERLVELPLEGLNQSRSLYLTYRTNRQPYRTVKDLIQFIIRNHTVEAAGN